MVGCVPSLYWIHACSTVCDCVRVCLHRAVHTRVSAARRRVFFEIFCAFGWSGGRSAGSLGYPPPLFVSHVLYVHLCACVRACFVFQNPPTF